MKKLQQIPTNIITGFLGSGKTTLIRHLLQHKPAGERWAVLVNEFGEIGVDASLLNPGGDPIEGIAVAEVAGGCMCCAMGVPSKVALNQLIRRHKPDRILIEPTGLAHPQQVLTLFSGEQYQPLLDVRASICVVDPWCFTQPKFLELPAFHSQLQLADVILVNKLDKASSAELQAFDDYIETIPEGSLNKPAAGASNKTADGSLNKPAEGLFNKPAEGSSPLIVKAQQGEMDWQLLDRPRRRTAKPRSKTQAAGHTAMHKQASALAKQPNAIQATPPLITELVRKASNSDAGHSCGWLLPRQWQFDLQRLERWITALEVPRVKGVINSDQGWQLVNRMRHAPSLVALSRTQAQQEYGRLEIISPESQDWDALEEALLACLMPQPTPRTAKK